MKINLNFAKGCRTTEYAAQELKMFLNLYTAAVVTCNENEADANICLCTDDTLKLHCYTLCGDGTNLKIAGGNASSVRIIHGKGTGALRAAVQQSLRKNKYVKKFRLGVYGEGEDGVTIAEFR